MCQQKTHKISQITSSKLSLFLTNNPKSFLPLSLPLNKDHNSVARGSDFCSQNHQTRIHYFSLKNAKSPDKAPKQNLIHQIPSIHFHKHEFIKKALKIVT
jgi:hypothetical protein